MPARIVSIEGREWRVFPSGRITQLDRDEFGIVFLAEDEAGVERRVTRYSPMGVRSREASLAEMSLEDLTRLFSYSQPSTRSPEAGYGL